MICQKCGKDFPENKIQESHDVPCYLFNGIGRKDKKPQADKWGRHWLCDGCHRFYEVNVIAFAVRNLSEEEKMFLRMQCKQYSKNFFKDEVKDGIKS